MYPPPSPPPRRRHRGVDYANSLPDECLALIFNSLTTTTDRNNSSHVSHRWLRIEAQTRTHLTLNAISYLQPFIPSIFTRFNSLTQLVLRNSSTTPSINDDDMILITSMCRNLTRLKLSNCRQVTDSGMAVFTQNCNKLKEFSCCYSSFSDLGMFALLDNCTQLEVLSVKMSFNVPPGVVGPKFNNTLLKVIKLRNVFNHRLFTPLIISSFKNLKCLKMNSCGGKMGRTLEMIPDDNCLVEVHLDHVSLSDVCVSSLAKCRDLIALHINNARCKEVGLISIVENCKGLKKLYVGNSLFRNEIGQEIGDEGLIAVGKHCVNLEELVLSGVKATYVGLQVVATNCQNLVRLELCHSDTITDVEMMCIVEKFVALKILRIEECGVSNNGIKALGLGCPNLVNLYVIMCREVTREVGDLLTEKRGSLVVKVMYVIPKL